jgi:transcriptional regulator with XRE-family HTH domain
VRRNAAPTGHVQRFSARLRRLLDERGWKQADLARAMDADRAGVSRLVNGLRAPERETLEKIARALDLPPAETRRLYTAAGYEPPTMPPTRRDASPIRRLVRHEWLARPLPAAALADVYWTLWDANEAFVRLFTARARSEIVGRNSLEMWLDPRYGVHERLRRMAADEQIRTFLQSLLAGFLVRFADHAHESWYQERMDSLRQLPGVDEVLQANPARLHALAGEVAMLRSLDLLNGGRLLLASHQVRRDPRFVVVQAFAADARSASLIEELMT